MTHSALLVIDMQGDYLGKTSRYHYYPDALIDKVNECIRKAQQENELIIYIKNRGKRQKMPYVSDFVEGLLVLSSYVFEKEKASTFTNLDFQTLLKEHNISELEVIGIDGNCCVASTALDAVKLGYLVTFPLNYIGISSIDRFVKTKERLENAGVRIIP